MNCMRKMKKKFNVLVRFLLAACVLVCTVSARTLEASAYSVAGNRLNTNYVLTGNCAEDIVAVAKAQLGKKYPEFSGFNYRAWCADFVSACAVAANASDAVPGNASVSGLWSAIVKAGGTEYSKALIQGGRYVPKRGDIIIFKSNGSSHVGIVDYTSGSTIHYIDGNWVGDGNGNSAKVHASSCSFSYGGFTCVVAPKYRGQSASPAPAPAPAPAAEIVGHIDAVEGRTGAIYVRGWAYDKSDIGHKLAIDVYIGGTPDQPHSDQFRVFTESHRPDLGVDGLHGVDIEQPVSCSGTQTVYIYAVNDLTNAASLLCTTTVNIPARPTTHDPEGAVDLVVGGDGTVRVAGWAFDADDPSKALTLHVYVGGPAGSGASVYAIKADRERADVGASKGCGNFHGFDSEIEVKERGTQEVYVYAINTGGGTNNPQIAPPATVTINEPARKIIFHSWISKTRMGEEADVITKADTIYLCYRVYDEISGKLLNELQHGDYSVRMRVFKTDGAAVCDRTYQNNDNNYISLSNLEKGRYTCQLDLDGSLTCTLKISTDVLGDSYTIRYDANGGTGAPASQTKEEGVSLKLSSSKPTKEYTVTYRTGMWLSYQMSPSLGGAGGEGISYPDSKKTEKKVSCIFNGWNTRADGSGTAYQPASSYETDAGAVLYAQWKNAQIGEMPDPGTPEGYLFDGWYTSQDGGEEITSATTVTENITVYARYTKMADMKNGTEYSGTITAGQPEYYQFKAPEAGDYVFETTGSTDTKGYLYRDTAMSELIKEDDDGGEDRNFSLRYSMNRGERVYLKVSGYGSRTSGNYALSVRKVYTIRYNGNGAGDEVRVPDAQTVLYGKNAALSGTIPSRNYTITLDAGDGMVSTATKSAEVSFVCWNTMPDGSGSRYQPGDLVMENRDLTLYAQWKNPKAGTLAPAGKEGFVFNGWYTEPTGGTRVTEDTVITGNTTLYAQYTEEVVQEKEKRILENGGTLYKTLAAGDSDVYQFTAPAEGEYVFYSMGTTDLRGELYLDGELNAYICGDDNSNGGINFWIERELEKGQTVYLAVTGANSRDKGFYSVSARRSFLVEYNANGGTGEPQPQKQFQRLALTLSREIPENVYTVTYDANLAKAAAPGQKKLAVTFREWNTRPDGDGSSYEPGELFEEDESVVLYAQWEAPEAGELAKPSCEGYTFEGWYTEKSGGQQVTASTKLTGSVTLYGRWTAESEKEEQEEHRHEYQSEIRREADCTNSGTVVYTCSGCGDTYEEELPAKGHKEAAPQNVREASCEEDGYTGDIFCSVCGELLQKGEPIASSGAHAWDAGTVEKEASCAEAGRIVYRCGNCGEEKYEEIPATNHTESIVGSDEATCEEEGYTGDTVCSVCGALLAEGEIIPEKGHAWDGGAIVKAPSETEEGLERYTCTVCGDTKDVVLDATGSAGGEEGDEGDHADEDEPAVPSLRPGQQVTDAAYGCVYTVKADSSVECTGVSGTKKVIVVRDSISVNGTICKVTSIAGKAFANQTALGRVTVGKYVVSIGAKAFYGCKNLTSVKLGSGLTAIGANAFAKCTALKSITIPASVKSIGKQAFSQCKNLKTLTIKTNYLTQKNVGAGAFKNIYKKVQVKVPGKKFAAYKKILTRKGIGKKAVWKKNG